VPTQKHHSSPITTTAINADRVDQQYCERQPKVDPPKHCAICGLGPRQKRGFFLRRRSCQMPLTRFSMQSRVAPCHFVGAPAIGRAYKDQPVEMTQPETEQPEAPEISRNSSRHDDRSRPIRHANHCSSRGVICGQQPQNYAHGQQCHCDLARNTPSRAEAEKFRAGAACSRQACIEACPSEIAKARPGMPQRPDEGQFISWVTTRR